MDSAAGGIAFRVEACGPGRCVVTQEEHGRTSRMEFDMPALDMAERLARKGASGLTVRTFANCAAMRLAGWTRGVSRDGGTYRDSWDDAEVRTYGLNTSRDRDRDGRACER